MITAIRKRWWFLARLSIALVLAISLFYGCDMMSKPDAGVLLCIILIIFAWAYACTINLLVGDYKKLNRRRKKNIK